MAEEIEPTEGEDICGNGADETGRYGNDVVIEVDDLWVKSMEAKLASKYNQPSPRFTICRVPGEIRKVDNDAYEPLVVSIGPYHRGNPNLQDMEEVKWCNLKKFSPLNEYLKELKKIEPRARQCYSGNINMEVNEFIEMMLLDGLFIIQLLKTGHRHEAIFNISGMWDRVGRDMLLLENQLPFFVLKCLWDLACKPWEIGEICLSRGAYDFINFYVLRVEHKWDDTKEVKGGGERGDEEGDDKKNTELKENDVYHLLHLVHSLFPKPSPSEKRQSMVAKLLEYIKKIPAAGEIFSFMKSTTKLLAAIFVNVLNFLCCKSEDELPPPLEVFPSVTMLHEAGVQFQCVSAKSFLDIKFDLETMKMPRLSVQDSTKSVFRNFIAFEQRFPQWGDHFTSYCSFMDDLIKTPRDVEILTKSQIIENLLGSDQELALFFNALCKGVFVPNISESYLGKSYEEAIKHTQKTWPKWRAILLHDYFNSPWSIISFFAASCIIVLTFVKTFK